MNLYLNKKYRVWFEIDNSYVIGYAFHKEQLLKDEMLWKYLQDAISKKQLDTALVELNGFYAAVIDKVRSIPLLYGKAGGISFIADNALDIDFLLQGESNNSLAIVEFYALGYLSGNKTLYVNVKNVEAGTYVVFGGTDSKEIEYHRHIYPKFKNEDEQQLLNQGKIVLENSFRRMIQTIGERQIVIPLSGGYDSRLMTCLCKKFNLENVICFTYGVPSSPEVNISRMVAEKLGFPWYYVEYSDEKWQQLVATENYNIYLKYAGNLNAEPCIQDYYAIKSLIDEKLISHNAVILPGHSADLLGGSHLPNYPPHSIVNLLYDQYYTLNLMRTRKVKVLKRMLTEKFNGKFFPEDILNEYNNWGIKVRQAHFIINSVRVYEYFGLSWRIPFWDAEFSEFWNSIPWVKKQNSTLYNKFVFEKYFKEFDVEFYKSKKNAMGGELYKMLPYPVWQLLRRMKKLYSGKKESNINSFDGLEKYYKCKSVDTRNFIAKRFETLNSMLSIYYVQSYLCEEK